jgi:hypothetical protein
MMQKGKFNIIQVHSTMSYGKEKSWILAVNTENFDFSLQIKSWERKDDKSKSICVHALLGRRKHYYTNKTSSFSVFNVDNFVPTNMLSEEKGKAQASLNKIKSNEFQVLVIVPGVRARRSLPAREGRGGGGQTL